MPDEVVLDESFDSALLARLGDGLERCPLGWPLDFSKNIRKQIEHIRVTVTLTAESNIRNARKHFKP